VSPQRDHYAVLGVDRTATAADLRRAFRRLARAHHPDANRADPDAERRFKRIARAWAVLGDPGRRQAYDARLRHPRFGAPGAGGPQSFVVEHDAPIYHMDLGHHSDFYQAGDPLSVPEAARLVGRHAAWLRRAIRAGRLPASRSGRTWLLRRRDVERLDRTARRRRVARTSPDDRPDQHGSETT
jgi:excisionase family DNA binding protein